MQFPTPESIIDYLIAKTESYLDLVHYNYSRDTDRQDQTLPESEKVLTSQERMLFQKNMPKEILYPLEPIWGNPSPISPMQLGDYLDIVAVEFSHYIISLRYQLIFKNDDIIVYDPTVNDPRSRFKHSRQFRIDPQNPVPTLVYLSLIQTIFNKFGHMSKRDESQTKPFLDTIQNYLLNSELSAMGVERQKQLYAKYIEAVYFSHTVTRVTRALKFPTTMLISEILYAPQNPKYNGWGLELDRLHANWRVLPEFRDFNIDEVNKRRQDPVDEVLKIIRKFLVTSFEREYAFAGPGYRESLDVWQRRTKELSPSCDQNSYSVLEGQVRELLPLLNDEELCQIVDRNQILLENYQSVPCGEYSRDDLLELLQELIGYLPKSGLCYILSNYGPKYGKRYNV